MNGISESLKGKIESFKTGLTSTSHERFNAMFDAEEIIEHPPIRRPFDDSDIVIGHKDDEPDFGEDESASETFTICPEFVTSGKAVFTIEVPEAYRTEKAHYTFRVDKVKPSGRFTEDSYFVKLLTGPDNKDWNCYSYLGKLSPDTGDVKTTKASKFRDDSYPVKLLNRVLFHVWDANPHAYESYGFYVHHEGQCGRCGLPLTVPESIRRGIGPECAKHVFGV